MTRQEPRLVPTYRQGDVNASAEQSTNDGSDPNITAEADVKLGSVPSVGGGLLGCKGPADHESKPRAETHPLSAQ